jgi:subtilisin family serine protease
MAFTMPVRAEQPEDLPNGHRVIVVFDTTVNEAARDELVRNFGGENLHDLPLVGGRAVVLPSPAMAEALTSEAGVVRVDPDVEVQATAKPAPAQPSEEMPWGVNRVDADLAWSATTGAGKVVAVVDTGIDKTHPDLAANIVGGRNFVRKGATPADPAKWNDDNGHGTHVAGTVAALDNDIGVVGVAPEAKLLGVKVLDRNGNGYLSDVIAGLNWVIDPNGDGDTSDKQAQVVNMSLGTDSDVQSFHDAVTGVYNAGVVVVAAAGNDGGTNNVDYPAAYPEVIAVAATDSLDTRASWSSGGPEVELSAPGVSVKSTYKGGAYATMSGTSMASPHVAGTVALVLTQAVGTWDANANGAWDVEEVRAALRSTADDLGAAGPDSFYGWGLVDAQEAATGVQTLP